MILRIVLLAWSVILALGCEPASPPGDLTVATAAPSQLARLIPSDQELPSGREGASILRGRALVLYTRDSLPHLVGNQLNCTSCHLDGGIRPNAMPLVGVYARFPQYRGRSGLVELMEDRITDCFLRSMNGRAPERGGRDMRDMIAWFGWISRNVPVGAAVPGQGMPAVPPHVPDTANGQRIFARECARCHGSNGEGTAIAPPVWGENSYNIGAGMARIRTLAAFLRHNMPYDRPGSLTDQQAYDLAAFINGQPRPDFPGKELDWPFGDPPPDVAYPTNAVRMRRPQ